MICKPVMWKAALLGALSAVALQGTGLAQVADLTAVHVTAATPLGGGALAVGKLPYTVETLSSDDIERTGLADVTTSLNARLGALNINDNLDDPFQPDILFRGFEASPVLGAPQGLAVYQNGVRINESFGDTLNWDLIPDNAVARIDVVGSNPLYGLNALGGAVTIRMKTGFDAQGVSAAAAVGSFGREEAVLNLGGATRGLGLFLSARQTRSDGWRRFSPDLVRQLYGAADYRGSRLRLSLTYTGADNRLEGEGPTPVQELAVSRRLTFTSPQVINNRLSFLQANAAATFAAHLSAQGGVYLRRLDQSSRNGNTSTLQSCADAALAGQLCQADEQTPALMASGAPVPDISQGGATPIGQIDDSSQTATSAGLGGQVQSDAPFLGRANLAAAGASLDVSRTRYAASSMVGLITPDLQIEPGGYVLSTPEGGRFTATPVSLVADSRASGLFATDTFEATPRLSLTAAGRLNQIHIGLHDHRGTSLSGAGAYRRFNPSLGATYALGEGVNAYLGYSEGSRAPTPGEIECANPQAPCLLPSSLSSDPPTLRQVVSQTVEAGLRGAGITAGPASLAFQIGLYSTKVRDDIYAVTTTLSTGYFTNIPATRRQGLDLSAHLETRSLSGQISYSLVNAVFDCDFIEPSPSNPLANANGGVTVRRGDQAPGVPRQRLKASLQWRLSPRAMIGADLQWVDRQYYRGDEANLLAAMPGFAVLGLHGDYQISKPLKVFTRLTNATSARYSTFGVLGDPTGVGAPGVPASGANPRFQSPAAPLSFMIGVKGGF